MISAIAKNKKSTQNYFFLQVNTTLKCSVLGDAGEHTALFHRWAWDNCHDIGSLRLWASHTSPGSRQTTSRGWWCFSWSREYTFWLDNFETINKLKQSTIILQLITNFLRKWIQYSNVLNVYTVHVFPYSYYY